MSPVTRALLGGLFTWGLTALGGATVFFFKDFSRKALNTMLGFAAGVMIAASFWSLLAPAIEMSETAFPAIIGFLLGGAFLHAADRLLPHLHAAADAKPEGVKSGWQRSVLLVMAITLHNIPEGLAFGVAFGSAALNPDALASAVALTVGIGIQNFPEGAAVSVPLRREGLSRAKSFFVGQASGIVEPLSAMLGAALAVSIRGILPYALAFAAGAMIFVVVEELIPEAQGGGEHSNLATIGAVLGFAVMMALDTLL
ncbi:MAG: ZIP family metal transporter [Oscillospiraceae bacterium]|jgi:ZIP family zinc transporter|nr:ZIP family metal transporter [Oscillospiraceae bacterium]